MEMESETVYLLQQPRTIKDDYGIVWILFVVLGVGALLPWNCLLAPDYWSIYGSFPFMFYMSLAFNCTGILSLLLSVKFGRFFSFGTKIIPALFVEFVVLVSIPIIIKIVVDTNTSRWFILGEILVVGFFSAIFFGTVMSLASLFPPSYIGAVMTGNGIAGIMAISLQTITKVTLASNESMSTDDKRSLSGWIYFSIAAFFVMVVLACYFVLLRRPFAIFYLSTAGITTKKERTHSSINSVSSSPSIQDSAAFNSADAEPTNSVSIFAIFKKIWHHALNVFLVFFVSLALFPGITGLIAPSLGQPLGSYREWFPIIMLWHFMVFDFFGRFLPRLFMIPLAALTLLVWIRIGFFALFILMALSTPIIQNDFVCLVGMAVFALTNGYCGSLSMIYGPQEVETHEKQTASIIMSLFLNLGISAGVFFAFLPLYFIKGGEHLIS